MKDAIKRLALELGGEDIQCGMKWGVHLKNFKLKLEKFS